MHTTAACTSDPATKHPNQPVTLFNLKFCRSPILAVTLLPCQIVTLLGYCILSFLIYVLYIDNNIYKIIEKRKAQSHLGQNGLDPWITEVPEAKRAF
jgi:hypothetical protein